MKKTTLKLKDFEHLKVKNDLALKGGDDGGATSSPPPPPPIVIIDEQVGRG